MFDRIKVIEKTVEYIHEFTSNIKMNTDKIIRMISDLRSDLSNAKIDSSIISERLENGYELAEQIFNEKYEKSNIELVIIKTAFSEPMMIHRGKRVDLSNITDINIRICDGEPVDIDMERR